MKRMKKVFAGAIASVMFATGVFGVTDVPTGAEILENPSPYHEVMQRQLENPTDVNAWDALPSAILPGGWTDFGGTWAIDAPQPVIWPGTMSSWSTWNPLIPTIMPHEREHRYFDDPIDQAFFNQFGENFQFLRDASTQVNRRAISGSITLEVLCSVAVAGNVQPGRIIDRATGEVTEDWDNTEAQIQVFTFFSVDDSLSEIDFTQDITLNRAWDNLAVTSVAWGDEIPQIPLWAGNATFLHKDEATGRGYFVIRHDGAVRGELGEVNVDFAFESITGDFQMPRELLEDINLIEILQNHEANFIQRENENHGHIFWGSPGGTTWLQPERTHVVAPEVSVSSVDVSTVAASVVPAPPLDPDGWRHWQPLNEPYYYVTERGQLEIPLHDGLYLTNLALRGNYLHVQTRRYENLDMWGTTRLSRSWLETEDVRLVDKRVEEILAERDNISFFEPENIEIFEGLSALRDMFLVNTVDLSVINLSTHRPVDNQRYTENIYRLASADVLEHLAFQHSRSYFAVHLPVNLTIQPFYVQTISNRVEVAGEMPLDISNRDATISDIVLNPFGFSLTVHDVTSHDVFGASTFLNDVYFINDDGTEFKFFWNSIMNASNTWDFARRWPSMDETASFDLVITGWNVIDLSQVAGIRINDITLTV